MHSLLCGHDTDPRYAAATVKACVAELYLPLLSIARDTLPRLHDFAGQWARGGWAHTTQGLGHRRRRIVKVGEHSQGYEYRH